MGGWNPWRTLRGRPHIELGWHPSVGRARGVYIRDGERTIIVMHPSLSQVDRNAVLAHELIHDERGIAYDADTPPRLIVKEEAYVDRIRAHRLIPSDELARFVQHRLSVNECVTVADVAKEFGVPESVAALAVQLHVA